jgi:hypothetical protein
MKKVFVYVAAIAITFSLVGTSLSAQDKPKEEPKKEVKAEMKKDKKVHKSDKKDVKKGAITEKKDSK